MYYREIKKRKIMQQEKNENKGNLVEINRLFNSKASLVSVKNCTVILFELLDQLRKK